MYDGSFNLANPRINKTMPEAQILTLKVTPCTIWTIINYQYEKVLIINKH